MATYLVLNLIVIVIVVIALRVKFKKPSKPWMLTFFSLMILTAIFDNVIINLGIVAYDETKLLGAYLGSAPIEDFFYAVLAAVLMPVLWNKLGGSND